MIHFRSTKLSESWDLVCGRLGHNLCFVQRRGLMSMCSRTQGCVFTLVTENLLLGSCLSSYDQTTDKINLLKINSLSQTLNCIFQSHSQGNTHSDFEVWNQNHRIHNNFEMQILLIGIARLLKSNQNWSSTDQSYCKPGRGYSRLAFFVPRGMLGR